MVPPQQIRAILDVFEYYELTAHDFLYTLLLTNTLKDHPVTESFSAHVELCLDS